MQRYSSRPDLRPPSVTVTAQSAGVAPGDEFVAPYGGPGQAGPMILDPRGELLWFKPLPAHASAANLRVQEYEGRPVLTWWQGDISVHGFGLGEDVIADQSYTDIAHVKAGNGLQADLHDFQLTPQATALITAYDPILCNLSSVGGPSYGAVTVGMLQEIDVKTGLVMFQWSSLDHVALGDSYEPAARTSTSFPYDFFHINSINLDPDGSLLVSARNTWTVYDLDARSGEVEWRLGGKRSSFAMGPGTSTAWQHDPRLLANGSISIFDNGASPTVHRQSRGIVVGLNLHSRTATLLGQIIHSPPLLAESQGNVQALSNGDWFVGWGQVPELSEFNAAGELLFDAHFPAGTRVLPGPSLSLDGLAGVRSDVRRAGRRPGDPNRVRELERGNARGRLAGARGPGRELAHAGRAGRTRRLRDRHTPARRHRRPDLTVQALDAAGAVIGTAQITNVAGLEVAG